jgi:hypothetical protein
MALALQIVASTLNMEDEEVIYEYNKFVESCRQENSIVEPPSEVSC